MGVRHPELPHAPGRSRRFRGVHPCVGIGYSDVVPDITATDAGGHFTDLLDGVEHRGEHYTIVRRGRAVAQLASVSSGRGADVKSLLSRHSLDMAWLDDAQPSRPRYRSD